MSGSLEGDLIRPLGLVTLNFGYAEAEVKRLLTDLKNHGISVEVPESASLGRRLKAFEDALGGFHGEGATQVRELLERAKPLLERRNQLIHASVLSGGRVKPNDGRKSEYRVTPEELTNLAEQIFTWKDTLSVFVQKTVLPELR